MREVHTVQRISIMMKCAMLLDKRGRQDFRQKTKIYLATLLALDEMIRTVLETCKDCFTKLENETHKKWQLSKLEWKYHVAVRPKLSRTLWSGHQLFLG